MKAATQPTLWEAGAGGQSDCAELKYASTDKIKLLETALAVEEWYKGKDAYDFATNAVKAGATADEQELAGAFRQLVWKASKTASAYAVRGQWAYAWFCPAATLATDNAANVARRCTIDKRDICIESGQLEKHNDYRVLHKDAPALKADKAASAGIQKLLDAMSKADFDKKVTDDATTPFELAAPAKRGDAKWAKCVENYFIAEDDTDAKTEKASETWYAGNAKYDYATGKAVDGATDAEKLVVD